MSELRGIANITMSPEQELSVADRIEALLFAAGEPMSIKRLGQALETTPAEIQKALDILSERLKQGVVQLIRSETEVALAVASKAAQTVKNAQERELGRDIGDAGLEVLSIVLYKGPSTRAQIDYIRGVNTSSTIRNLLARGLLERTGNPEDGREYLYRPTVELMAHLGANSAQDLPEYATIAGELAAFARTQQEAQQGPFEQNGGGTDNLHDGS